MTTVLDPVPAAPPAAAGPAQPMNVLHVSTYADYGGSGRAAYRIHQELLRRGWGSKMLVARQLAEDPDVAPIWGTLRGRLMDRACAELTDRLSLQYWFVPSSYRLARHPWFAAADIVHLYNIHSGYFSYPALIPLSRRKPIVWHLSDMWSFTGHCSYSYDCTRWQTGCGACPMLKDATPIRRDTTALLWRTKRWVYERSRLAIVVRSQWMGRQVQRSPLLRHLPMHLVRNGVDTALFHPVPKTAARQVLGLPAEGRMLFFSADSVLDPRKGAARLAEALNRFAAAQAGGTPLLLVAGHGADAWARQSALPVRSLGYVADQRMLATAYAAADLFLLPSRGDNAPNGLLESMACGTPAVTFNVGGCGEIVRHRDTGYLADPDDAADFARGITELLSDETLLTAMGRRGRDVAEREYSMTVQVDRYADVYRQVRERWQAASSVRRRG